MEVHKQQVTGTWEGISAVLPGAYPIRIFTLDNCFWPLLEDMRLDESMGFIIFEVI